MGLGEFRVKGYGTPHLRKGLLQPPQFCHANAGAKTGIYHGTIESEDTIKGLQGLSVSPFCKKDLPHVILEQAVLGRYSKGLRQKLGSLPTLPLLFISKPQGKQGINPEWIYLQGCRPFLYGVLSPSHPVVRNPQIVMGLFMVGVKSNDLAVLLHGILQRPSHVISIGLTEVALHPSEVNHR